MMSSNFKPTIIKPYRSRAKSPRLNKIRVIKNLERGIDTSLLIDLNILSKMNEVIQNRISFNNSGLKEMVRFFNKIPSLSLLPGLAFLEASQEFLQEITTAYENFIAQYCPGYIDHPNATKDYLEQTQKPQKYSELPLNEKYLYSATYLGTLQLQIIPKEFPEKTPEELFEHYIEYMMSVANVIGVIEAEAAKYCFFNHDVVKDAKFKIQCREIKRNFKKGGQTPEKRISNAFNAARDIMYHRMTVLLAEQRINGRSQDCWLLTADKGLVLLTNSVYYTDFKGEKDFKYASFVRTKEQRNSSFWKYCDQLLMDVVSAREYWRKISGAYSWNENTFERLLNHVAKAEDKIRVLYKN